MTTITIGLTAGKSTLTNEFKKYGALVIDADKICHEIYDKGCEAYNKMIEVFGEQILNDKKEINRAKISEIVFKNKNEMKKLTDITWPAIANRIKEILNEPSSQNKVRVIEAAVLFEADWKDFDQIWVICTDPEIAINRLMKRNNLTEEQAKERINNQMSNEERIKRSDVAIWNNGDINETIESIHLQMKEKLHITID